MLSQEQIEFLERALPPIIARVEIERFAPGLVSPGRLANLDAIGEGPRQIKIGRKVGYTREDFIRWLSKQNEMRRG